MEKPSLKTMLPSRAQVPPGQHTVFQRGGGGCCRCLRPQQSEGERVGATGQFLCMWPGPCSAVTVAVQIS